MLGLAETPHVLVGELFLSDRWDLSRLHYWLPDALVKDILDLQVTPGIKDQMVWVRSPTGKFSVSGAWSALRQRRNLSLVDRFVWSLVIPEKISFFVWRLLLGWVPLDEQLQRKDLPIVSKCSCCGTARETLDQLFVTGPVASEV